MNYITGISLETDGTDFIQKPHLRKACKRAVSYKRVE